jgi:hypothetical protein
MHGSLWIVVPALLVAVAAAAIPSATQQAAPLRSRDQQVESLVAEAMAAPPEFAADVLIQTAESPRVTDDAWRRELLDDAYAEAFAAQQPYRRTSAPISPDTRQGAEALAADTRLNRVSLQVRVVQLMRFIDPARARELFGWIELTLDPDRCEVPLVPALDEYYAALTALARQTFPDTPEGRSDGLSFFEMYLWRARSGSELPLVATAARRFHPDAGDAAYLQVLLNGILQNSERTPRAFATSALDIASKIADLQDADRAMGVSGSFLLAALRQYLVRQLSNPRCSDSTIDAPAVEMFNAIVRRREAGLDGVAPISAGDIRSSRPLGHVTLFDYWTTPDARRLHDDAVRLRGTGRAPIPLTARQSALWLLQADRHLVDVQQWSSAREATERDYFYEKGALFANLIELVPGGPTRVRVLRAFADFLHHDDAERQRPLWFFFANRLLELIQSEDRDDVLQAIGDTGDQVLSLYAHAAQLTLLTRQNSIK